MQMDVRQHLGTGPTSAIWKQSKRRAFHGFGLRTSNPRLYAAVMLLQPCSPHHGNPGACVGTSIMHACMQGVANGSLTVGDAVLFVTLMQQLYAPLNYFGTYYRTIQQYMIDMENMFDLLASAPQIQVRPPHTLHTSSSAPCSYMQLRLLTFCIPLFLYTLTCDIVHHLLCADCMRCHPMYCKLL